MWRDRWPGIPPPLTGRRTKGAPGAVQRQAWALRGGPRLPTGFSTKSCYFGEFCTTKHPHRKGLIFDQTPSLRTKYRLRLPCWKSPQTRKSPDLVKFPRDKPRLKEIFSRRVGRKLMRRQVPAQNRSRDPSRVPKTWSRGCNSPLGHVLQIMTRQCCTKTLHSAPYLAPSLNSP